MKKLLLLAVVVFVAASCEKPKGDELYMYAQDFEVLSQDWVPYPNAAAPDYYYFTFRMNRLTSKVCEIGEVTVTRYTDDGQAALPETLYNYEDGEGRWSENISYDYAPGEITFKFASSNFNRMPGDMNFRVVLNY